MTSRLMRSAISARHLGAEAFVTQPLGRNEQDVRLVAPQAFFLILPVFAVVGSDPDRTNPHPLGGGDLVPHQGEQREMRSAGPAPASAQQPGRDEVDEALAPSVFCTTREPATSFPRRAESPPPAPPGIRCRVASCPPSVVPERAGCRTSRILSSVDSDERRIAECAVIRFGATNSTTNPAPLTTAVLRCGPNQQGRVCMVASRRGRVVG